MHIFPQLRKIERKYANEVAVVGVHSAKFPAEKETENIRKSVLRYDLEHPVVNDRDFLVWKQYTVRAWPTLMFVDPEGKVIGKHEGEIQLESLDKVLGEMVAEYDDLGLLDHTPLDFKLEKQKEQERPLSFPGKVLADQDSGRLFIADSNHNRIVVTTLGGDVLDVVGSGTTGFKDGAYADASFNDPQGLALDGNALYVADTKNHAIRMVDLEAKTVSNVAGTGEQAASFHGGGNGRYAALNSPWDVEVHDGKVYIAMAGFHQLWSLDPKTNEVTPHAGNGRERIVDGDLLKAELAQPSGIVAYGEKLYFTDSESSAIRVADIDTRVGKVSTIVGMHLFEFGDVDGHGDEVRLQHPLGIDVLDGVLIITDTYNNKIKKIFPESRESKAFLGSGQTGHVDGPGAQAQFHEPGGLSVAGNKIYVADTNNHAIRTVDLDTLEVGTLELKGL